MSIITNLTNGTLTAKIDSLGAQLLSLNDGKTEYMWQADENVWNFTAPVLFPICGSLKNSTYTYNNKTYTMKNHGFARFMEFEIEKQTKETVCYLLKSNEETLSCYPFEFEFRVIYELVDNRLNITYSATNKSNGNMYFSFGGHEGYACPRGVEEYAVKFENDNTLTRLMLKEGMLSGETEEIILKDNVLELYYKEFEKCTYMFTDFNSDSVIFFDKNDERKLRIGFEGHNTLAIWTLPERKYLCIEPWCGISEKEGFNGDLNDKNGIIELLSQETYKRTHYIEVLN